MEHVKVSVVEFSDRKFYMMQFVDPVTGRKKTRSTKVERTGRKRERTEAERVAAKWEADLRNGRYREPSKVTWIEFRERYEEEVLPGLADRTSEKVSVVFNTVESVLNPVRLRDVTADRLSYLQSEIRKAGRKEDTIAGYVAHLKAALSWAVRVGLLPQAPRIERPRRAKGSKSMKGRPITGEEFDRMLAKAHTVVGQKAVASWQHYLTGLWWSGLRLTESLELYWDRDDRLCVDLTGEHAMLRIPAEFEKGHRDRLLPMAPEFAEFLLATPEAERAGPVFKPRAQRVHGERLGRFRVSEKVAMIGKAAGVKVATDPKTGKVKYASAHDLRRSFGERWAARIMPPDLMLLMRHETIDTTMRYYVGRNAQNTAKTLWEAHKRATDSNTFGNTTEKAQSGDAKDNALSCYSSELS